MLRYFYTLLMYLVTPLMMLRLLLRVRYHSHDRRRYLERFGIFSVSSQLCGCLWVHAVSMGEVNAVASLVRALQERYPKIPLVLTTVTSTGSAQVRQLFGDEVFHVYLPYDLPFAVRGFLKRLRPCLGLIVETEIWPNLYFACHRQAVALMIVNARLSERSLRSYRPFVALLRSVLRGVYIAAQSRLDAARYRYLGAESSRVIVSGNLKFDMPLPCAAVHKGEVLRQQWGVKRPVWMAASTHDGEESLVLAAHRKVLERQPDSLLLLAARHPERFRLVEQMARDAGFSVATRALHGLPGNGHQVFIINSMGELMPFYAASQLAFVGGSLVQIGGHNVLEPAALSKPFLVGPYTFNFREIVSVLIEKRGGRQVDDGVHLVGEVCRLLADRAQREHMGRCARNVFDSQRGAVDRVMGLVDKLLQGTPKDEMLKD